MNLFVLLVLLFAVSEAVLTVVQFLLRKRSFKPAVRVVLIVCKLLLAIAFAVLVLAGPVQLRVVQPLMMAAYVALFADGVADLCYGLFCHFSGKKRSFGGEKVVSLVFGAAFLVFGILNMQTVSAKYHTITSEKLKNVHKIVFAADIHVGSAQPFSVTQKTVEAIKSEQPDAVVLGGDICDDYTTKAEMQDTFALFKDFGCPVYYVYGNHDLQGHAEYANGLQYTEAEFEQSITQNGIMILRDSFAQISRRKTNERRRYHQPAPGSLSGRCRPSARRRKGQPRRGNGSADLGAHTRRSALPVALVLRSDRLCLR